MAAPELGLVLAHRNSGLARMPRANERRRARWGWGTHWTFLPGCSPGGPTRGSWVDDLYRIDSRPGLILRPREVVRPTMGMTWQASEFAREDVVL